MPPKHVRLAIVVRRYSVIQRATEHRLDMMYHCHYRQCTGWDGQRPADRKKHVVDSDPTPQSLNWFSFRHESRPPSLLTVDPPEGSEQTTAVEQPGILNFRAIFCVRRFHGVEGDGQRWLASTGDHWRA